MAEKRFIDANGSYTLIATDNTQYGLCFGGGIISVINWHGSVVAEFYADDAPAADVAPVVHAEWIPHEHVSRSPYARNYDCSACGNSPIETGDFCNKCGAKMDGGVNHGDA